MSQNTVQYQQRPIEDILDFCVELSKRMIASGANLERIYMAVEHICHSYGLTEVSIFLLSTQISISARDDSGYYAARQSAVTVSGIHLERLRSLNQLCFRIAHKTPSPRKLRKLLDDATNVKEYKDQLILLARIIAMSCLCLIFGGGPGEVFAVAVITVLLHYLLILLAIPGIDRILTNAVTMWITTAAVFLMTNIGIADKTPVVIITLSMLVIPGIPLANAMRNLLCGNEMNGILQTARATVETMALAMGIYVAILMFGSKADLNEAVVSTLTNPVLLVILSFIASCSFGAVFRIQPRDLPLAGLGGVLTRIVMLILTPYCSRLAFVTISAFVASIYAEILATVQKKPSTYYVYPSIIPILPGDLFYYALVGVYNSDKIMVETNGINCALSLASLSIGFVLSFVVAHYFRKMKLKKILDSIQD